MYRPETSNFLVCALLKRDTIEFYLIDYFNFVIVDNTTGNIVSIVTELAQSGVFYGILLLRRVSIKKN